MGQHVVGYLMWGDFVQELRVERPKVVRVQTYHRGVPESNPPLFEFCIDVVFLSGDGTIHFAHFYLGSEREFVLHDHPDRLRHFYSLLEQGEQILRAALAAEGVEVRRGVLAGTDRLKIETNPAGLWRREKGEDGNVRLVPEGAP